jgi:hypothetical protein
MDLETVPVTRQDEEKKRNFVTTVRLKRGPMNICSVSALSAMEERQSARLFGSLGGLFLVILVLNAMAR